METHDIEVVDKYTQRVNLHNQRDLDLFRSQVDRLSDCLMTALRMGYGWRDTINVAPNLSFKMDAFFRMKILQLITNYTPIPTDIWLRACVGKRLPTELVIIRIVIPQIINPILDRLESGIIEVEGF